MWMGRGRCWPPQEVGCSPQGRWGSGMRGGPSLTPGEGAGEGGRAFPYGDRPYNIIGADYTLIHRFFNE